MDDEIRIPLLLVDETTTKHMGRGDTTHKICLLDVHNDIARIDRAEFERASRGMIQMSRCDQFQGKSFYLDSEYDWVMGYTTAGRQVLVPLNPKYPSSEILNKIKGDGDSQK